jgi:hypothetical protein
VSADDKDTLYFKEKIGEQLRDRFKAQLEKKPEGTVFRKNLTWYINRPNFSRKDGRRIFWTSRIDVGMEAGIVIREEQSGVDPVVSGTVSNPVMQWLIPGAQETALTRIIHVSEDKRSLLCYKHVGETMFAVQKRLLNV